MNLTTRLANGKVLTLIAPELRNPHSKAAFFAREAEWVKRARQNRLPVADFTNGSYVPRGSERGA